MKKFALIGIAGYIAPRHLQAIKETGNELVAALDKSDTVGIIDSYFPNADFFTEFERFDRHLDKIRRSGRGVNYVSICSPNYLHDSHIRFALRQDAEAICEKPLVLNPWNIDALANMERETGRRVFTILQLRLHPGIVALKKKVTEGPVDKIYHVDLTYITSRGNWYYNSWKGDISKSGGVATNIGIHFFDMLLWVFGKERGLEVREQRPDTASGTLETERARINWRLSINESHLPEFIRKEGKRTFRALTMEGEQIEFSDGFTELHTLSYKKILDNQGFGLDDARPSIELVHKIRRSI